MDLTEGPTDRLLDVVFQETRWRILDHLVRHRRATVADLAEVIGCTRQNVHHHLKELERHGLARVVDQDETRGLPRHHWAARLSEEGPTLLDPLQLDRKIPEG